jgi:hypothetical protein
MGRPPTTLAACRELHDFLLRNGEAVGSKFRRPDWDRIVVAGLQVGLAQAKNITGTGRAYGLWDVIPSQGRLPGSVLLLAGPDKPLSILAHVPSPTVAAVAVPT